MGRRVWARCDEAVRCGSAHLHELARDLIQRLRTAGRVHLELRRRLVNQIDRLVWQEPLGDVTVGEGGGGDER